MEERRMTMKPIVGLLLFSLCVLMLVVSPAFAQVMELKDGVERLAAELSKSVPTGRTLRVAVTDFPDLEGVTSNLGRYVAERLTTRLSAQTEKFRVIERRRLGQVLGELNFSMSDLVDPSKAKQLGGMLGSTRSDMLKFNSPRTWPNRRRSEEHTSELQSQSNLVCRL